MFPIFAPLNHHLAMRNTFIVLLFSAFSAFPAFAQNFFDPNKVQEIKLTFYQNNWDYILDSLKAVNESAYLLAPKVEVNGVVFDSVGVKYKGNSTYKAGNAKNPLHIELDYVKKKQDYNGIKDIKLSNCWSDPTFVREPVSYEILRQYMVAPQTNHSKVWMNGQYWGVYVNQESINKDFVKNYLHSSGDNPFFKCNPEQIGGPGTGGNYPDLVYTSADSSFYYKKCNYLAPEWCDK
jgi:spore coat protein CotH